MYSQLRSDGGEPQRASSDRFFKVCVALSVGLGFSVGAIVVLILFPRALHDNSVPESTSLAVFPTSGYLRGAQGSGMITSAAFRQPFLTLGGAAVHLARGFNSEYGEADGLSTRPYQFADKHNDAFYGLGTKQVQQSASYVPQSTPLMGRSPHEYGEGDGLSTRPYQFADKHNDAFYGLGTKQVQQSASYVPQSTPLMEGLPHEYGEADGLSTRPYQFADKHNDAFYGLGTKQGRHSAKPVSQSTPLMEGLPHEYGEADGLSTRPYQFVDKQSDSFYGLGTKQAQQSGTWNPLRNAYGAGKGTSMQGAYGLRHKQVVDNEKVAAKQSV